MALFLDTLQKALQHKIADMEALRRIVRRLLQQQMPDIELSEDSFSCDYEQREAFQSGRFSQEQQFDLYQQLLEDEHLDDKEGNQ